MTAIFNRHPWLLVVLAFALLLTAWTSLIVVAVKNQPEKVPLEHPASLSELSRGKPASDP